ncbi:hypothetical protein PG991_006865 [Apiospora marii]|uniref:F-box domain-containing protein n=1 Tax=Apiospora marii TaxID=335849 RepID=A0ABR1S0P8_9PEZI
MDLNSSTSGSSDGSVSGETNYANYSKYFPNGGDSNESTAPEETGSSGRDNGEGPSRRPAASGGSPDDDGSDSDETDDGNNEDGDNGETHYANRSKYSPNGGDEDESPIPEDPGGNVRDNGEGPSRRPAAAGGSPGDPDGSDDGSGSDDDGDDGDDENNDSGYDTEHNENSDDDDTVRDLSVMPDVIDDGSDDSDDSDDGDDNDGEDMTLWSHQRLMLEYNRKRDEIRALRIRYKRRIRELTATIDTLRARIRGKNASIRDLEGSITDLQREIATLQDRLRGIRPAPVPWSQLLQNVPDYSVVYKAACQQLNMSQVVTNVHPQLRLSIRRLEDWQMRAAYGLDGGDGGNGNGNGGGNGNRAGSMPPGGEGDDDHGGSDNESDSSDNESDLFVRQDSSLPPAGEDERPRRPFHFNKLPRDVQERIFRYLFLQGFFWGGEDRQCCVTLVHRPNSVLRLLLVCKRWLYLGVHAFYGLNTFAFSSLGELGRFMKGIGSRMERIVNLELFWHGAIMPRQVSMVNQRTLPLQFFCDTRRLKTLVIHLQELDERRTRRKYEIRKGEEEGDENRVVPYAGSRLDLGNPFKVLMESTRIQPNHRQYRSIRTMHGLDFVYQLRGMNYVRIREAQGNTARQKIRDWSVIDDINSVVTLPKEPNYEFASELDNLSPIRGLANFLPTEDDKQIVRRWYADDEPMGSVIGEDDDGDTISIVSSEARSTPSLSDDESDDDDGSDDDDSNTPSANGGSDNDSGVDVDMDDVDNDSGDDSPSDNGTVDDLNEDLDQMSINDDSDSIDEDVEDNDNMSTTTDSSGDSDDSSRPHDTGTTGITSDYSTSANVAGAGGSQGSRRRADTVSSSAADAGGDAGDMGIANADDDKESDGDDDENKNNGNDRGASESSGLFVPQRGESSIPFGSNRESTYFKTESEEEKKRIIDLTSDDNAGPSRAAGHASDESTKIKEESSSGGRGPSRPRGRGSRVAGANVNTPMEIDDDDDENVDSRSTTESWKGKQSPVPSVPEYLKRQSTTPSEGQRSPKRRRANTPSESGRASNIGSTPDTPIPLDED